MAGFILSNFKMKNSGVKILTGCCPKQTFGTADIVSKCVVFNIGGGKYRLIVRTNFLGHRMWIKYILSHKEYEKLNLKEDPGCRP